MCTDRLYRTASTHGAAPQAGYVRANEWPMRGVWVPMSDRCVVCGCPWVTDAWCVHAPVWRACAPARINAWHMRILQRAVLCGRGYPWIYTDGKRGVGRHTSLTTPTWGGRAKLFPPHGMGGRKSHWKTLKESIPMQDKRHEMFNWSVIYIFDRRMKASCVNHNQTDFLNVKLKQPLHLAQKCFAKRWNIQIKYLCSGKIYNILCQYTHVICHKTDYPTQIIKTQLLTHTLRYPR